MTQNRKKTQNFDRSWRIFANAVGFFVFGLFGVIMKVILLPFTLRTATTLNQQLQARTIISTSWRYYLKFLNFIGVFSFEFHGAEKLGKSGQLIIANHPSLLDVVFMIAYAKNCNCVVKQSLQQNTFLNSPIRACGYIPNDGSPEMIEHCAEVLKCGESLLIFPEGTRTGDDGTINFHRGACAIALRGAKTITPVVIKMSPRAFKKDQAWYQVAEHKIHYKFIVGDNLDPQDWLKEKPAPIAARQLNQYLQHYFEEKLNE
ncbi:1-acyl-sn-glycerol-3-phosphate acyltransferase [Cricetibacter osteomyelitidis]|uniref:1-acyl-sn-glycerol-3-phosphate acyltransferase n=1 Tax=Cricetibacter osteomyelitidis TaxID=1521931 RepID=A0A4R2TJA8_9PAST|nr:lysophospholipid acyltransferase family protein [Cricetibacter osteomyelitidis]TCP94892.1 1-acyl-sn-glycerol-3-phosphate acyltransferase [Cricetibacter osteomyelitidis]